MNICFDEGKGMSIIYISIIDGVDLIGKYTGNILEIKE